MAPAGVHRFYRERTGEVLVFRPAYGTWLSICGIPSLQRKEECRALVWGQDGINDSAGFALLSVKVGVDDVTGGGVFDGVGDVAGGLVTGVCSGA